MPYSDLSILPEGVLFKKIHVQEEQKRINVEIRRSTTVPLRESVSSLCRGHHDANLLEAGAGVDRVSLNLSGVGVSRQVWGRNGYGWNPKISFVVSLR